MNKISVVIQTYNASKHLDEVLCSVAKFDEVIVCDMESTDNTLDIAKKHGCRIVEFEKKNFTVVEPLRNAAVYSATHEWVLVVDADEIVPNELREYLYNHINKPNCADGLLIPRKNYFMGQFMRCLYPDYILRFFRKEGSYWPVHTHSVVEIKGRVEKIPQNRKELAFIHLANDRISNIVSKTNFYTDNEVEKKKNRSTSGASFIFRPAFRFFKTYFIKKGFLDGKPGLIRALNEAYYQMILLSKIEERKREEKGIIEMKKD